MHESFWQKQTATEPLYPDLLWSRPENKHHAGKLLIVGGNLHGFAAPAEAYQAAISAGIGTARVLLPDAVKKIVGPIMEHGEFAPSTPSGSFSQKALAEVLDHAQWSDGVLFAGDLGRNSETAILIEKFLDKYTGQATLTKDAVDYYIPVARTLENVSSHTLVLSFAQLQKLGITLGYEQAFTFDMGLVQLVELLHEFTKKYSLNIITKHLAQILVSSDGKVVTTTLTKDVDTWRVSYSAAASVWLLQNPKKPLEALVNSVYTLSQNP